MNDKISRYHITDTEAVFVDCESEDIFDPKHVFVYHGQFLFAKRMFIMPLTSFYMISKQIKKPDIPIIHLANHGRCGSTFLSNVFDAISGTLSISETNPFTDLAEPVKKRESSYIHLGNDVEECRVMYSKTCF